jgi:hypothetical protein
MVSEIIIGSTKLFNLVGFTITFLKLNVVIKSTSLLLWQSIPTKTITVRDYDKPWFNNEIRKEIRLRDRLRKNVFKFGRESDTLKYKKQRKVNFVHFVIKEF